MPDVDVVNLFSDFEFFICCYYIINHCKVLLKRSWILTHLFLVLTFYFLFKLGGSEGLFAQKTLEITDGVLSTYKNQGFLWIGVHLFPFLNHSRIPFLRRGTVSYSLFHKLAQCDLNSHFFLCMKCYWQCYLIVVCFYPFKGGFDLLGRTKDQIRTTEQVNAAMATCLALKLDGLVIIGGYQ